MKGARPQTTRLERIESKVNRLRELMGGANNELPLIPEKSTLGITKLRRA